MRRQQAAVIVELLSAIGDLDASFFANVFVMGTLIGVLEAPSSTYVVDQNMIEIGLAGLNIIEQFNQASPVLEFEATFTIVTIGSDNCETMKPPKIAQKSARMPAPRH